MHLLLYIAMAIVALAVAFVVWATVGMRKGVAQASEAVRKLRVADIASLVGDGKGRLATEYGIVLDLANREAAAKALDGIFDDRVKLRDAFEKDGFRWRFVLPVGRTLRRVPSAPCQRGLEAVSRWPVHGDSRQRGGRNLSTIRQSAPSSSTPATQGYLRVLNRFLAAASWEISHETPARGDGS